MLKDCSKCLNESLDILPISDGQIEIETMGALTTKCKELKVKLKTEESTFSNDEIPIIFKNIENILEKPKDTLSDHIKTLKVCSEFFINVLNYKC